MRILRFAPTPNGGRGRGADARRIAAVVVPDLAAHHGPARVPLEVMLV